MLNFKTEKKILILMILIFFNKPLYYKIQGFIIMGLRRFKGVVSMGHPAKSINVCHGIYRNSVFAA